MEMIPRTTAPNTSNKYYIHISQGGLNPCILIAGESVLPNCVGYAYGRFMESAKLKKCDLPRCNAEDWYKKVKGIYKRGKKPKVGAIICWSKGKVGVDIDGAGHVAFVEAVYEDGSILISQSGYGASKRMWTQILYPPFALAGYDYQGCIYNPKIDNTITKIKKITFKVGKEYEVKTTSGLNVRGKATKNSEIVRSIPCGTKVTCKEIDGNWMRIKGGWICTKEDGKYYVQ